jgi:hypothetical protein
MEAKILLGALHAFENLAKTCEEMSGALRVK